MTRNQLSPLKGGGGFISPPLRPALPPSLETSPHPTLLFLDSCSTTPRINLGVALKKKIIKGNVKGHGGQPLKMAGNKPITGTMQGMGAAKKGGKYTWI